MLNWQKFHFLVTKGIVLEHKTSIRGIEIDQAKIEVIENLPLPQDVKGVRNFLGHAGFYGSFIQISLRLPVIYLAKRTLSISMKNFFKLSTS